MFVLAFKFREEDEELRDKRKENDTAACGGQYRTKVTTYLHVHVGLLITSGLNVTKTTIHGFRIFLGWRNQRNNVLHKDTRPLSFYFGVHFSCPSNVLIVLFVAGVIGLPHSSLVHLISES